MGRSVILPTLTFSGQALPKLLTSTVFNVHPFTSN